MSEQVRAEGSAPGAFEIVIEPPARLPGLDGRELWRYRELLVFLAWRDVSARYRQTALGAAWAVLQPLSQMLVFALVFGRIPDLAASTGDVPYALSILTGLVLWTFFANAVTSATGSLVGNVNLVTKTYFPRLVIPLATVAAALVDLSIALALLIVALVAIGRSPGATIMLAPLYVAGTVLAAAGLGSFMAALLARYRDVRAVMTLGLQLLLFVSPVVYPLSYLPDAWRPWAALNPLAGMIEGFRASLLGGPLDARLIATSGASAAALFVMGTLYFKHAERGLADRI